MKKLIYILVTIVFLSSCNIQKKVVEDKTQQTQTETTQTENTNTTEKTDKNTTTVTTITKYITVYDTITKSYPIESVTTITETNNDKIDKHTNTNKQEDTSTNEETNEHKSNENKVKSEFGNYAIAFGLGCALIIIILLAIKAIKWHIKKRTGI